jgi:hypothetical protein
LEISRQSAIKLTVTSNKSEMSEAALELREAYQA